MRSFVHADEMMIIVKATTEGDEHDFQWEWIAAEANSPRYLIFKRQGKANKIPKDYELNPTAKISNEKEVKSICPEIIGRRRNEHWMARNT